MKLDLIGYEKAKTASRNVILSELVDGTLHSDLVAMRAKAQNISMAHIGEDEGMSDLISGPCVICGEINYPRSLGGPSICPRCDCGPAMQRQPHPLESENAALKAQIEELEKENRVLLNSLKNTQTQYFIALGRIERRDELLKGLRSGIERAIFYDELDSSEGEDLLSDSLWSEILTKKEEK